MNDAQKTLAPGDFRELTELHDMASQACELLKAMANEWRLIILCQLSEGEKTVSELQSLLGLSQSALSQHLAVLRQAGVVNTRKDGINVYYSLKSAKISEACSLTRQILLERLEDHVSLSDLIKKTGD